MTTFPLPEPIVSLVIAQQTLREHYASSGLTFTFDGVLPASFIGLQQEYRAYVIA